MENVKAKIKIVIVDDHNLVAEAWKALLNDESDLSVVGTAKCANSALSICLQEMPDVVLMDINLKDSNGLEATEMICNKIAKVKVVGLSLHDDISIVKQLMSRGASGYLSKNSSKTELVEAIHTVMSGDVYLDESIRNKLYRETLVFPNETEKRKKELTAKEIEIVKFIANGITSKQMAEQLFVSIRTIETHRHNVLKKMNLQNAAQLSSWARENGYY